MVFRLTGDDTQIYLTKDIRIERVDESTGARFTFLFNRTKEPVSMLVEGRPVVMSLADCAGATVTINPNGVLVVKQ